jgi:hypothetical protein
MGDTFTPAEFRDAALWLPLQGPSTIRAMLRYAADVLEKLPVTADGVRVVQDTRLFESDCGSPEFFDTSAWEVIGVMYRDEGSGALLRRPKVRTNGIGDVDPSHFYSTCEAALAARQDGGEG